MSSISEWLDIAFVVFDNPSLKTYNEAKVIATRKRLNEQKTDLQRHLEEKSSLTPYQYTDVSWSNEDAQKWRKQIKRKRLRNKPKLTHYEKTKKRLKKQTDAKRLKMIEKLKKEQK
jgi:hypothetical protein